MSRLFKNKYLLLMVCVVAMSAGISMAADTLILQCPATFTSGAEAKITVEIEDNALEAGPFGFEIYFPSGTLDLVNADPGDLTDTYMFLLGNQVDAATIRVAGVPDPEVGPIPPGSSGSIAMIRVTANCLVADLDVTAGAFVNDIAGFASVGCNAPCEGSGATPTPTDTAIPPTNTPTPTPGDMDDCPGMVIHVGDCLCDSTEDMINNHECTPGHEGPDVVFHLVGLTPGVPYRFTGEAVYDADWTIATVCDGSTGDILCVDHQGPHIDPSCSALEHQTYGYATHDWLATQEDYWIWVDSYFWYEIGGAFCIEVIQVAPTPTHIPTKTPGGPTDTPIPPTYTPTELLDDCPGEPIFIGDCVCQSTVGMNNDYNCTPHSYSFDGPDVVYHLTGVNPGQIIKVVGEADYDADWGISSYCTYTGGEVLCEDRQQPHEDPSCSIIDEHAEWGYATYSWTATESEYWIWVDTYGTLEGGNYCLEVTSAGMEGENCGNPHALSCNLVASCSLEGWTNDYDDSDYGCGSGGTYDGGDEVWALDVSDKWLTVITIEDSASPAIDLFVTEACPGGECLGWGDNEVTFMPSTDTVYVFVDCPAGSESTYGLSVFCEDKAVYHFDSPAEDAMGMAYYTEGCTLSGVWIASQQYEPGTDNLHLLDADTYGVIRSFDTTTINGWPTGGLVGITLNQDEKIVCTDFQGDVETYDDTIMLIDPLTGVIQGYVETDGDNNDSTDGAIIDEILGIEHIAGTTDEYLATDYTDNSQFTHIKITWGMPGTWEKLHEFPNLNHVMGIDYDACNDYYWLGSAPDDDTAITWNTYSAGGGFTNVGTVNVEVCPNDNGPMFLTWLECEWITPGVLWGSDGLDCYGSSHNTLISIFTFGVPQGTDCPCADATPTPGGPTPTSFPTNTPRPSNTPLPTSTATYTPAPTATPGDNDFCPGTDISVGSCICGNSEAYANLFDCGDGFGGPDLVFHLSGVEHGETLQLIGEGSFDADWAIGTSCDESTGDILCADHFGEHEDPRCSSIDHHGWSDVTFEWTAMHSEYWIWVDGFYEYSSGDYCFEINSLGFAGEDCDFPYPLACDDAVNSYLSGRLDNYNEDVYNCGSGGNYDGGDEVWAINVSGLKNVTIQLNDEANPAIDLFVKNGCPGGECLQWDDVQVEISEPADGLLFVFVDCPAGNEAEYGLTVTCEYHATPTNTPASATSTPSGSPTTGTATGTSTPTTGPATNTSTPTEPATITPTNTYPVDPTNTPPFTDTPTDTPTKEPTPTTGSGTPTNTPLPTNTPTDTPTDTPTTEPTPTTGPGTPTNTPLPPTDTPTPGGPTASPSGTPTITPTPGDEIILGIITNAEEYRAGDVMEVAVSAHNYGEDATVDVYIAASIDGVLFFYPLYSIEMFGFMGISIPAGFDLPSTRIESMEIDHVDEYTDVIWYFVMTDAGTFNIRAIDTETIHLRIKLQ